MSKTSSDVVFVATVTSRDIQYTLQKAGFTRLTRARSAANRSPGGHLGESRSIYRSIALYQGTFALPDLHIYRNFSQGVNGHS